MAKYNTQEIREAAARLTRLSAQAQSIKTTSLSEIGKKALSLQGETSDALQSEINLLGKEITSMAADMDKCANILYEFARRLDIADQKAKQIINEN